MSRDSRLVWHARDRAAGEPPRVIVIGAGIGGLSTGCYAQMSGAETRIFERHVLPGGGCTAWSRQDYIFDYCIEWLIGTGRGNDASRVWRELGALDGKTMTNFEMFNTVTDEHGRSVTFYNDPDRLERHLLELSPADARPIRAFCRDLRRFTAINLYPFLTPSRLQTLREKLVTLRTILPALLLFRRAAGTRMERFCERFQDPLLRRAFPFIFFQDHEVFPLLPYLFNMAGAYHDNCGFPQGGSLGLARSVEERYTGLGGRVDYRARVERILVENDRAVGVELRGGERHYADHIVSACDGATTLHGLLEGRYTSPRVEQLFTGMEDRPELLYPGVVSAFVGLKGELDPDSPHSTTYLLSDRDSAALPGVRQKSLVVQMRSRYSDGFAPQGKSVIHCTYFSDYASWKTLRRTDRKAYWARKQEVADFVRGFLERQYPGMSENIEVVDVASPVTTERYTGVRGGSILGWKSFTPVDGVLDDLINKDRMSLAGLEGLSLAGQWFSGGGLIRAASSGRFVTQYLCRDLGLEFRAWESGGTDPWHPGKLGELPQLEQRRVR
ncbi:phytoene desaturase family protein [Streptomyces tsukubensis]|uniref:FAD-dependent oxidoreductase n=1 Tax=Streptomyces tsukubensis TaxID=83656 RepID=A0A1V4A3J5_9ACTN|nr:NAD(P)/FAD-dependent oxidoreductase [Streptomyces tsukubensis]OON73880.1 FAD-dependent oxidoreductase [Streptomyces tsukubensis]QFR91803.1 NAD(P)-binding protein [Streptomyces tsukubensis]